MILKSQRERAGTHRSILDLEKHLRTLQIALKDPTRNHQSVAMEIGGVEEVISDLRQQVADFDHLYDSDPVVVNVTSLTSLPPAVVWARVASGLTQAELAKRCNLDESAIQRYERGEYRSASQERLMTIIDAIGIPFSIDHRPGLDPDITVEMRDVA